jgi:hypothetical protein
MIRSCLQCGSGFGPGLIHFILQDSDLHLESAFPDTDPDPRPDPTCLKKSTYFCKFIPFVIDIVGDEMRISLEKLKNAWKVLLYSYFVYWKLFYYCLFSTWCSFRVESGPYVDRNQQRKRIRIWIRIGIKRWRSTTLNLTCIADRVLDITVWRFLSLPSRSLNFVLRNIGVYE